VTLDPSSLLLSVLVSAVGVGFFLYGKKQQRAPQLAVGLVMIVYTYFVSSVALMLAIAVGLLVALWLAVKMGW
jgi:ABC-type phosphate transport system permease subunit